MAGGWHGLCSDDYPGKAVNEIFGPYVKYDRKGSSMPHLRRHRTLVVGICAGMLVGFCAMLPAAELKFVTEYRYPTAFEVVPIGGVNGEPIGAVVTPTDFETREVGVVMSVSVAVGLIGGMNAMVDGRFLINGNTPLMVAATAGDLRQTRKQLKRGVDVNAENRFGSTALLGAAAGGYSDIVDMLLEYKANVNAQSKDGNTPLIFAAKNGHADVVNKLLGKGALVNTSDDTGRNALMHAVAQGHAAVVQTLLKNGARADTKDRDGVTPLMLAQKHNHRDIVVLLTRGGKK